MVARRIQHGTTYRYRLPFGLGPHRLMLRPRESPNIGLITSEFDVVPDATVTWAYDVFSNAVATASFDDVCVVELITE